MHANSRPRIIRTRNTLLLLACVQTAASCGADAVWNPFATDPTYQEPRVPPPSLVAITPNIGSVDGATSVTITGSQFNTGARVTLGGITLESHYFRTPAGTTLYAETAPHAAGAVDLIVTNPGGQADTLRAAYTYALPSAFEFEGTWWGFGTAGQDLAIVFTVTNGAITRVSCDLTPLTISPPIAVTNGEFSYRSAAGATFTGRIVSQTTAVGTMDFAPCSNTNWSATRWDGPVPAPSGR
ncbi:MAG: IPT/TIG domain-containing protein [bacterium]